MAEKKSPLSIAIPSPYPFEDEAIKEKRKAYEEALARVTKSLDQRKSRIVDPKWAAAAEAFLTPKATGSSFESFGLLAKNLSKAQREEEEEEKMISAQNLELARAGLDMSTQAARTKAMLEQYGVAPSTGGAPGFQSPGEAASDKSPLPGAMNKKQFVRNQVLAGVTDPAKIEQAWAEYSNKMSRVVGGMAYTPEGRLFDITARVKKQIPELKGGTYNISLADSLEYDESYGDPVRRAAIVDKIDGRAPRPSTPAAAPSATPAAPLGAPTLMSEEELAAKAAGMKVREEGTTTSDLKRIDEFAANADNAGSAIMIANMVKEIASSPNARNFIGVYSRPGVAEALKRAVVDAAGNVLGLPEIREILTNAGLTKPEVDQNQRLVFFAVNTQLETAKLLKGAVSDFETKLVGKAGYSPDTSPETLQFQADYVVLRKTFDQDAYNAFSEGRDQGKWTTLDQFKRNPVYKDMKKQFEGDLMQLAEGKRLRVPSSDKPAKPAARSTPKPSSKASDEGLDVPDQVPAGVVINRRPL